MPGYEIPGRGTIDLGFLVLDLNGTLTIDGQIIPGVAQGIQTLQGQGFCCYLLTADTRGTGSHVADTLGLHIHRLSRGHEMEQKQAFVEALDAVRVAAIGNGTNDAGMLDAAAVGIAVIQAEGAAWDALRTADVVAPDICAALDMLANPLRLVATLRS